MSSFSFSIKEKNCYLSGLEDDLQNENAYTEFEFGNFAVRNN